jgi:hypothetical protein
MKTFKNFREGVDIQEAPMDGVAKGSLPDDQHMCATKIFKEGFGEGTPILGEHSLPDADGNVAWYKVMFEHGVEIVTVGEEGVAVLEESNHSNHKKKMKEEVEEIEEISKKTLGSYIKKATTSYGSRVRMGKEFERDAKETRSATDKKTNSSLAGTFDKGAVKRKAGIMKATDKLVNKKN